MIVMYLSSLTLIKCVNVNQAHLLTRVFQEAVDLFSTLLVSCDSLSHRQENIEARDCGCYHIEQELAWPVS